MRQRPSRGWSSVIVISSFLAAASVAAGATAAVAAGELTSGSATQVSGNSVEFRVYFEAQSDQRAAQTVSADLVPAGPTVPLSLEAPGTALAGWWSVTASVPSGSWRVIFRADALSGADPTLDGGPLTVPSATPSPTPTATPVASSQPTHGASPGLTATPIPAPPGATAIATAGAMSTPRRTAGPASTPIPSASATASAVGTAGIPGTGPRPSSTNRPAVLSDGEASAADAGEVEPQGVPVEAHAGDSLVPWLVLGGGMATAGATILVAQAVVVRRRRR